MTIPGNNSVGSPPPDTVIAQILAQAPDIETAEAMLLGSSYEGGWGPTFAVGDQGTSFGPFQMHEGGALTSSGLTPQQAQDPHDAVAAMLPAYEATSKAQGALWQTNPSLAAEQAATAAERPAESYVDNYGAQSLQDHWNAVQGVVTGAPLSSSATSWSSGGSGVQSAGLVSYTGTQGSSVGTAGTVLSYLDGFLNPKISAVPGIINLFTGINPIVSAVATIADRAVMIVVGVGLVYIGVRVVSGEKGGVLRAANVGLRGGELALGRQRERRIREQGYQQIDFTQP